MLKKKFLPTLLIAVIQYYDYYLYGLLAATLAKNFFAEQNINNINSQLTNAYIILALGMLARPFGSILLGKLGDIHGRFKILKLSLLMNSLLSVIIALTPTYEHIGFIATIILFICKMSINIFTSTGTDGVRIYIYENIGRDKQCMGNGFVIMATQIGSLIASFATWIFTMSVMPVYAWRMAFILGSILGLFVVRNITYNENLFVDNCKQPRTQESLSLASILKSNFNLFLTCIALAGCIGATYQFNIIFFGTFCFAKLKIIDSSKMQFFVTIAISLYMIFAVIAGYIADYFGRLKIFKIAFLVLIYLNIINSLVVANDSLNVFVFFAITACLPFMLTPALAFLKQSIPVAIRYRIFSLAHALGSIIFSATTPLISNMLYENTNYSWLPIIYFMIILTIIFSTSLLLCIKFKADEY